MEIAVPLYFLALVVASALVLQSRTLKGRPGAGFVALVVIGAVGWHYILDYAVKDKPIPEATVICDKQRGVPLFDDAACQRAFDEAYAAVGPGLHEECARAFGKAFQAVRQGGYGDGRALQCKVRASRERGMGAVYFFRAW